MNFKRLMIIFGGVCLAAVLVFTWGCQNQPTSPEVANSLNDPGTKFRSFQSGSHGGYYWSLWTDDAGGWVDYQNGDGGNYSVSWDYNGNFTCGKGWSSGSTSRNVGYNIGAHTHNSGGVFGYYGWSRNPLMEYYVNERWGRNRPTGNRVGSVSSDGGSYDIYESWRSNAPSIDGTQSFRQIFSTRTSQNSTGSNHTITFSNHANAWRNCGYGLGSDMSPAAILLTESYGGGNGYVNATVWDAGSSGGGGGSTSTTTTTSGGGGGGGGENVPYRLRARSTDGQGQVNLRIDDQTIATFTLGSSMGDYTASSYNHGGINVEFFNDTDGRDVQIDYLSVDGDYRQAEDQSYNTAVWQDGSCGGEYSEWMHCNGIIGFGDTPNPGGGGGGGSTSSTTTTSGSSWWGGGSWWSW
jgi:endo-1,4-beta-xylanase